MTKTRREFIAEAAVVACGVWGAGCARLPTAASSAAGAASPEGATGPAGTGSGLREQFSLDPARIHLSSFLLSSPPLPVQQAIAAFRRSLDLDPAGFYLEHAERLEQQTRDEASRYLACDAGEVALTGSTTEGLALVYGGLRLASGDELLATEHDHFSTHECLRVAARRARATFRRVRLYDDPVAFDPSAALRRLRDAIHARTRLVALTWVHSGTGVKLPIREIGQEIARLNRSRPPAERVLLAVDGVHAFGIEDFAVRELGCDFFVAGCHKSLFGPRGTGIVWGRPDAWARLLPAIPSFSEAETWSAWEERRERTLSMNALGATPGGFHAFENRWALAETFRFHLRQDRKAIHNRVLELSRQLNQGLRATRGVTSITPLGSASSCSIVCFEVAGLDPNIARARLLERGIVATVSPYAHPCVRLAPGAFNTPPEIESALAAVRTLV